jgi:hypothetical protein
MSGAKLLKKNLSEAQRAFSLRVEYTTTNEQALKIATHALGSAAEAMCNPSNPRVGVICYCFARSLESAENKLFFTELYSDSHSFLTHLTPDEGIALAPLFDDNIRQSAAVLGLNVPQDHDAVMAALFNLQPEYHTPLTGIVLQSLAEKPESTRDAVLVQIRVQPKSGQSAALSASLYVLLSRIESAQSALFQYTLGAWWLRGKAQDQHGFDKQAIEFFVAFPSASAAAAAFTSEVLAGVAKASERMHVAVTAEQWANPHAEKLGKQFAEAGAPINERRELVAGYIFHPSLRNKTSASAPAVPAAPAPPAAPSTPVAPAPPGGAFLEKPALFTFKRHTVTKVAEEIVFHAAAEGRSPHLQGKRAPEKRTDEVVVPLLHVLRKMSRLGHLDTKLPIGVCFGQLERLRALQRDSKLYNETDSATIEQDAALKDRIGKFLESISGLGYTLPSSGRVALRIEELDAFISALEIEFTEQITLARNAVENGLPVEHMGLMEVFAIGSLVQSRNVGALGGINVVLRVIDAYYEPMRSMFGGRKYSFRLGLETLVALGGEFVAVAFEAILEEWEGARALEDLVFVPVRGPLDETVKQRGKVAAALGTAPAHRHYEPGSFFPHLGKQNTIGGASSAHSKSASGRVMVDSRRGLELGHAPASAIDDCGLAIAAATKAYRNAQRSQNGGESDQKRLERLKTAGLRVFPTVPASMEDVVWPTVVAFSLSSKVWGHVLIDGLREVRRSRVPWRQLVLPRKTKEMLIAMASSTVRGAADAITSGQWDDDESVQHIDSTEPDLGQLNKAPRYHFRDVIEGKVCFV